MGASHWLNWTSRTRNIAKSPASELTKLTKPSSIPTSVSSVSSMVAVFPNIEPSPAPAIPAQKARHKSRQYRGRNGCLIRDGHCLTCEAMGDRTRCELNKPDQPHQQEPARPKKQRVSRRVHGLRPQDVAAIKQFEASKREIKDKVWPIEQITPACRCSKYPFAHIHAPEPMHVKRMPGDKLFAMLKRIAEANQHPE